MLKRTSTLVALALLATMLLPGPASGARFTIKAESDETWSPVITKVVKGTKVIWKNADPAEHHTLKSYKGNWMRPAKHIAPGEKIVKRFKRVKRYYYFCNIHGAVIDGECVGMCGEIRVRKPPS